MIDLQKLLHMIEQLPETYQQQLYDTARALEAEWGSRAANAELPPEERLLKLREARDEFRRGISDGEMHEIAEAMNTETPSSDDNE